MRYFSRPLKCCRTNMADKMISAVDNLTLVDTRKGKMSLKVTCADGSVKTLHSIYDPVAEAGSIVDAFHFDGKGILVVLGLGLGYHVSELTRTYPDAEILVIEAAHAIYDLAREHGPEVKGRVTYITGVSPDTALSTITEYQLKKGMVRLSVFALSSAVSAFPDYYKSLLEKLNRTVAIGLWDRLRYSKFQGDKVKVLLIDTGYFLVREAEKALQSLDHEVLRVPVGKGTKGEMIIARFMEAIVHFRPDFFLTMNHLGFDEEGVLTGFFTSIEMPVACWYVDSPRLIVQAFNKNVSPWTSLFLWDKSYREDMESMGFDAVNPLPLGTDESLFKPVRARKYRKMLGKYVCHAGFVGNSMVDPVNEWMGKVKAGLHTIINDAADEIAHSGKSRGEIMSVIPVKEREKLKGLSEKEKMDFEAAVLWKATLHYRLSCIKELEDFGLSIYGDHGWAGLINAKKTGLFPPLNYYRELPFFYNACVINFNATSRQMTEAVNQRVFDVPACGAFLLTDHQDSLNELFHVGTEIITYKQKEEIADIAAYYLRHAGQREAVAVRGRERVLKDHTYRHRLRSMIQNMRRRYGRS